MVHARLGTIEMAGTGTVKQIGNGRKLVMAWGFATVINIGMTSRAGTPVRWPRNGLVVIGVAVIALNAGIVIPRVVRRVMAEQYGRFPCCCAVAAITVDSCDKVRRALADYRAAVVTG